MAKYKVLQNCFLESPATGLRLYQAGEIIEYDGVAGEYLEPVGQGPHHVEPRKFDIPGGEGLSLAKRAEIYATTTPIDTR